MSRARHSAKHRASGGKVAVYSGGESNVMKEAHERKKGGRVHHEAEGEEHAKHAGHRARKHGGRVAHDGHPKHHADGGEKHHAHMHKRARGGAVGAEKRPLSSAANIKEVTKGESKEDMGRH